MCYNNLTQIKGRLWKMESIFNYYESMVGLIEIEEIDGRLRTLRFVDSRNHSSEETALSKVVCDQLDDYFAGKRISFDVPFAIEGNALQMKVWRTIQHVPYGETWSYKQLARSIGLPRSFRAVTSACQDNPIAIMIPSHRVTGSNGPLGGLVSEVVKKQALLLHEQEVVEG